MKIKTKLVGSQFVKGVIDEKRQTVIPFEYDDIRFINEFRDRYDTRANLENPFYLCTKDGKNALYGQDGELVIGLEEGLELVDILEIRINEFGKDDYYIEANKDGKVGIIKLEHSVDDYGEIVSNFSVAYDFGKASYVRNGQNGIVLEKFEDDNSMKRYRIGFFQFDGTSTTIESVVNYEHSQVDIASGYKKFSDSDKVSLFVYSKTRKVKGVDKLYFGALQRVDDKYVELFPPKYGNISFDLNRHVFILSCADVINSYHSQSKIVGVANNCKGKRPSFKPTYSLDLGYNYEFIDATSIDSKVGFIKIKKRNKWGLAYYSDPVNIYEESVQDVEISKDDYSAGIAIPCKFDSLETVDNYGLFITKNNGLLSLVTVDQDPESKGEYTHNIIISDCESINNLEISDCDNKYFVCKKANNKYDYLCIKDNETSNPRSRSCFKIVEDADLVEIFDKKYAKVTKNGSIEVVDLKTGKKIENVKNVEHGSNKRITLIYKNDGTVFCTALLYGDGGVTIEDPNVDPSLIDMKFHEEVSKAVITINGESRLYTISSNSDKLSTYIPATHCSVVSYDDHINTYVLTEIVDGKPITKVIDVYIEDDSYDTLTEVVFEGQFEVVNGRYINSNLRIVRRTNEATGKYEYGVLDCKNRVMVIDFKYDLIECDAISDEFICKKGGKTTTLDFDGFDKIRWVDDDRANSGGPMRKRDR